MKTQFYIVERIVVNVLLLSFQESDLASVIVGLIQVVFTAVAAVIMDKAGRKVLLIISGIFSQIESFKQI